MLTLAAAILLGQYTTQLSVGFARGVAIAPPLPVNAKSKFKISIFNGTKKPVKFVGDGCSWGYSVVSFELKSPAGKTFNITRYRGQFEKNILIPLTIESAGTLIRPIDFGSGTWTGFPAGVGGRTDDWQIRAVVEMKRERAFIDGGFWMGKITSPWTPATVG